MSKATRSRRSNHGGRFKLAAAGVILAGALFAKVSPAGAAEAIPFATNGGLKMLYDNRQYPQAVADGDAVSIVWRGDDGLPYLATYDLKTSSFSKRQMLFDGMGIKIKESKYRKDHHFAPVIWMDEKGHFHTMFVDLPTGQAFNIHGEPVELPLRKSEADKKCLVWDTEERVAAVGPSIALDQHGLPHFMLPVSDKTPLDSHFYFVTWKDAQWQKIQVTPTLHPFNASRLEWPPSGEFRAFLIAGEGEEVVEEGMDEYGWGQRVEEWVSSDQGAEWKRARDLTPVSGLHYQNVQPVFDAEGRAVSDMLLFYGWKGKDGAGTAYLWDGR